MSQSNINIKNRKAFHEYTVLDKFIAGIQLTGTEIKSVRNGKANFTDSFCGFIDNELYLRNMHIDEYAAGSYNNHEPKRDRKLLLHKTELLKLNKKVQEKGLSIMPLRMFINERGLAKVEIALARGKKLHDKRDDIKKKDQDRDIKRALKNY